MRDDGTIAARGLPALGRLLQQPAASALLERAGRERAAAALRGVLATARTALLDGTLAAAPDAGALLRDAAALLDREAAARLRPVINATGVALHTNLGRAPLAAAAAERARAIAAGYCDLEFDLGSGERGRRMRGVEALLARLAGTEAALCVNNNAAAMLLAMSALAAGGEVVVSRGELVEIGGGFRIPDVISSGGARLVEVGTTNRTRIEDYRRAIGPHTRMLLKVHRSNYRMLGFVGEVPAAALRALAREHGVPLLHDLGGGAMQPIGDEPTVREAAAGADLLAFSGDKLFGGPQSGLLAGGEAVLAPLRRHPLMRAVRLDKLAAAALEATLELHADPERARAEIPALRMLHEPLEARQARAERLRALLGGIAATLVHTEGRAGGGTLPAHPVPSRAVALAAADPTALARALRTGDPAVAGRLHAARLLLDVLAVSSAELEPLAAAVRAAIA